MHEQSETIQLPDGSWVNIYGRGTKKYGEQLPGSEVYGSEKDAVAAAKKRSAEHGKEPPKRTSPLLAPTPKQDQYMLGQVLRKYGGLPNPNPVEPAPLLQAQPQGAVGVPKSQGIPIPQEELKGFTPKERMEKTIDLLRRNQIMM